MAEPRAAARRNALRPHRDDRVIMALAVPAVGALAADPLYSLIATAFAGNLGTPQLGAVAVGTAAFTASFWLFSFLAFGVTPRVARALGAGDEPTAAVIGVQALMLAVLFGCLVTLVGVVFAEPIVRLLGAQGEVVRYAEPYLRVRVLSATAVLVVQVGHGWLRGAQNTRIPMMVALAGAAVNVVVDYVLIYPVGLGVLGAAWGTVIGQTGVAVAFVAILRPRLARAGWRLHPAVARSLLVIGGDLAVRTGSLLAAMTIATAVAARMGQEALGAWQITSQVFFLLALTLDAIAVAGQALVGKHLGAGRPERAAEVSRRLMMLGLYLGVVLLVLLFLARGAVASLFSNDPSLVEAAAGLLAWLALVQPLSSAAFTLDGILMGASDTRFLAVAMLGCSALYVLISVLALNLGWGTAGLAAGAGAWLTARTVTNWARFVRGRWALQP
ncbi:MAG: MATE family efflux transporter [Actinomycetota bacterium]